MMARVLLRRIALPDCKIPDISVAPKSCLAADRSGMTIVLFGILDNRSHRHPALLGATSLNQREELTLS